MVGRVARNRINSGLLENIGLKLRKILVLRIVENGRVGVGVYQEPPTARMSPSTNFLTKKEPP